MKFSASTLLVACLAGVMAAPTVKEANFNEREMQIIEMLDANRDSLHLNNKNSQMLDQLVKLVHDQAAKDHSKSSPTKEKRQDSGDAEATPTPTPGGPLDGVTGTVGGLTGGGGPLGGVTGTVGGLTGGGGPLGGVTGTVGGLTGGLTGSGSDSSSKPGGLLGGILIPGIL